MIYFLTNTLGSVASTLDNNGAGTTATGYSNQDVINGARSTKYRTTATTSAVRLMYHVSSDTVPTHMIVTRADWMLTKNTMRVRAIQKNAANTVSYISGIDYNPLLSSHLIGSKAQDLIFNITPTSYRGFGIEVQTKGVTNEAFQISKLFISTAFSFDNNPNISPPPVWQPLPTLQNMFIPQRATLAFETEQRLTLFWGNVSRAKIAAFKALPQLLRWGFYLYDDTGDILKNKLEHVVIETWAEQIKEDNVHDIQISFLRLKYYE